jgi:hypothetical protein
MATTMGWLSVAVGLWLNYRAVRSTWKRHMLLANAESVKGKVVRLDDKTIEGDLQNTVSPVVRFTAEDVKIYEAVLLPRADRSTCPMGQSLTLIYEKGNPKHVLDSRRTWDDYLYCLFSLVPIVIGIGIIYTAIQEANSARETQATNMSTQR